MSDELKADEKKDFSSLDKVVLEYLKTGNEEKLNEIVELSKGLIYYFVRIYGGKCSADDLYQVGTEGVLKALNKYDSSIGTKFSTYAGHCIMGEIRHYVRKEASFYKPGCVISLQNKVDDFIENYLQETGGTPSAKQIAEELNIREESISEVMSAGLVSLDEIKISKISTLHQKSFHLPLEDHIALQYGMKKLSDLQHKVINLLFFKGMTQQKVSEELGINQRKVSRLKEKGLESLKKSMDDK